MARTLAIDYGTKRVGLAVTDPLGIIASPLTTVHAKDAMAFLQDYVPKEEVNCFVVGKPKQMDGSPSESHRQTEVFVNTLRKNFPNIAIERIDERFTSKIAQRSLVDSGLKKKKRQQKGLLDSVSATLILQTYLDSKMI